MQKQANTWLKRNLSPATGLPIAVLLILAAVLIRDEPAWISLIALISPVALCAIRPTLWRPRPEFQGSAPSLHDDTRGSVAVEAALSFPLAFVVMVGAFTYGQGLFTYNMLHTSIHSAARYGSLAPYDLPNGSRWEQEVKNMAVFGDPNPSDGSQPLTPGLRLEHITVSVQMINDEPARVTVLVNDFTIAGLFEDFVVSRPDITFPFLGRTLAR